MKKLVVIPAYDEQPTIGPLVEEARKYIPDILVVDDGSRDATARVAAAAGAIVHRLDGNMGKGAALKFGFGYAIEKGYDFVITMDGDGQHDPRDISVFLDLGDHSYDLVLGNRMDDRDRVPPLRRLANFASSFIVSLLCLRRIHDSQTGFRCYSARLMRGVHLTCSHYDLETEVIIKAARRGFRIGHCRIRTIYAAEVSRFRNFKDSVRFLRVVAKSFFWW